MPNRRAVIAAMVCVVVIASALPAAANRTLPTIEQLRDLFGRAGLAVYNPSQYRDNINWYRDTMVLNAGKANYGMRLQYEPAVGALGTSFDPGETKRGDIFFMVPLGFDMTNATLTLNMYGGPNGVSIPLAGLPHR